MKVIARLGFGSLLALASAAADAATGPMRPVPAYDLPVPATISPPMQAAVASAPPSDAPMAAPTTNAGWDALTNPDSAATHARITALLARLALTVREEMIDGVHCFVVTPANGRAPKDRLLMHIHGGAYVMFGGESGLDEALYVAGATGMTVVSVDYRMPPAHPFPVPVDEAVTVWKHLSRQQPHAKLAIFGTSTGGAMTLAVTQRAIAEHLRIPDAIVAGTPWSDLSETGDSYFTNRYADPMSYRGMLSVAARQYANGIALEDPRLSPIYGTFVNFPPTLLLSGTRDLFLSNTVRVDRKLRDAGRHSELIVYEGQSHGLYFSGLDYPETRTAMKDVGEFLARALR
jgi:monoterpene epsilon-lactone hydrolase